MLLIKKKIVVLLFCNFFNNKSIKIIWLTKQLMYSFQTNSGQALPRRWQELKVVQNRELQKQRKQPWWWLLWQAARNLAEEYGSISSPNVWSDLL